MLEELAAKVSPRLLEAPAFIDEVRRELDEYFDGRRERFDLPLDWISRAASCAGCCGPPRGSTTGTYAATGRWRAARATSAPCARRGNALGSNPMPVVVPCHRVVRTGGALGGYTGGLERKEFLLGLEGVIHDV